MSKLIIVCGSPGVGKTTYAKTLAASLPATLLDIDTCTEKVVRVALAEAGKDPNDRDSKYFKNTYRQPIYDSLFAIARENLNHSTVIVVGPFTQEIRDLDWMNKLKCEFGPLVEIHYLWCRPELRRARLIARGESRDLSKVKEWEASMAYFGNENRPQFEHSFIDTNSS